MATDEGLFRRVALTSLVVAAIVVCGLAAYFPLNVSISFALGAAAGLASLGTLAAMVRGLGEGGPEQHKRRLWVSGLFHIGKYGLIAAGLYLLFRADVASAPALAGGFTLPTLVLCLKGAGRRVNARMGLEGAEGTDKNGRRRG